MTPNGVNFLFFRSSATRSKPVVVNATDNPSRVNPYCFKICFKFTDGGMHPTVDSRHGVMQSSRQPSRRNAEQAP